MKIRSLILIIIVAFIFSHTCGQTPSEQISICSMTLPDKVFTEDLNAAESDLETYANAAFGKNVYIPKAKELGWKLFYATNISKPFIYAYIGTFDTNIVSIEFDSIANFKPEKTLKNIKKIEKITHLPFSLGSYTISGNKVSLSLVCQDFHSLVNIWGDNKNTHLTFRLEKIGFVDELKKRDEERLQQKEAEKLRQEKLDREIEEITKSEELRKRLAIPTPTPTPTPVPVSISKDEMKDDNVAAVIKDEVQKTTPPVSDLCETSPSPIIQGLRLGDSLAVLRKETNLPFSAVKGVSGGDNQYFVFRNARPNIRLLTLTFYKNQLSKILVEYGDDIQWNGLRDFRDSVSRSLNLQAGKWIADDAASTANYYMLCQNYTLTIGNYRHMQLEAASVPLLKAEKNDLEKKKVTFKP